MTSIALVFPRFIVRNFGTPLGALHICSALQENGFQVSFLDGTVMSIEETLEKLKVLKPGFLILSIQTVFADFAFQIAREFKRGFPNSKVIAGGPHATIMPEKTLQEDGVDFVVIGEGEITVPELIRKASSPEKVNGIAFKKNNKVVFTKPRTPIQNLDFLPFPNRSLLSEQYFKTKTTSIITSRGCPFNCAFCQPTLRKVFGNAFRTRSPENVIKEIRQIQEIFTNKGSKLEELHFTDDGLTYNKKWLEKLCNLMIEENLSLKWSANTRADTMPDNSLLQLLKKAGLQEFSIGVESGDPFIRNSVLLKGVSQEQLKNAFEKCRNSEIKTLAYFMVGSPEETIDSINATVELLDDLKPDEAQVSITSPLPGTFLADFAEKEKISKVEKWSDFAYGEQSHLKLKNFSKEKIKRIQTALIFAIFFRNLLKKKFNVEAKYSTLFKLFRPSPINHSMRLLKSLRFKAKKALS